MASKFCPNCGAPLEAGTRFCGKCGTAIEDEPAQQQAAPQPAAQEPIVKVNTEALQESVQQAGRELQEGLGEIRQGIVDFQPSTAGGWQGFVLSVARFYSSFPLMKTLVQHMFIIEGRTNRLRYLTDSIIGWLIGCVYLIAVMLVAGIVVSAINETLGFLIGVVLFIAVDLPLLIGGVLLTRSRLHDMNVTGWVYLGCFVPYINFIVGLVILLAPGTKGPNQYGQDPLAGMH